MRVPSSSGPKSTPTPCCSKVGIKRGPWTPEEDEVLANYVRREGEGRWRTLPKRAGLQRCGKSCRLRWMNYLRPCVKRGRIDPDEEDLILRLHRLLGNRWSLIAGRIPGRTDNEIKNYWNTHLSKKLISQGIDPRTHKPLDPTPGSSVVDVNNSFVPVAARPPSQPHPNVPTLEKPNDSPRRPFPIFQADLRGVANEMGQQRDRPVAVETGNWQSPNGMMTDQHNVSSHGNIAGQSYMINNFNNEDIFSSFLETLMDDNYASPYQRNGTAAPPLLASMASPTVNFNSGQGGMWDAELIKSALESLGDPQQGSHSNLHHITY